MSLIPAENSLAVIAALFVVASLGFAAEKTRWGKTLTGAVWTILGAILLSNLNIIPKTSPAYDFVFGYLVAILIPLFLFQANLRKIFFETSRMALAFLIASLGTVLGAILAFYLVDLGPQSADLAGIFTATYIGGSVNYAGAIETLGYTNASMISAATAVDNLASALFLAMLAVLPAWRWLASRFVAMDHTQIDDTRDASMHSESITSASLAWAITVALVIAALGTMIADALGAPSMKYLVITVLTVIPATFAPQLMARLSGAFEVGTVLAFVFFGAIAAGADIGQLIAVAPMLLVFVLILLSVHSLVTFGLGSLFKLSLPELIIASNAAILGATTAPALAAAQGWRGLVTPGVLVGVLGYAIGTFLGVGVAGLLG